MNKDQFRELLEKRYGTAHGMIARAKRDTGLSSPRISMYLAGKRPIPEDVQLLFMNPVDSDLRVMVDRHVEDIVSEAEVLGIPMQHVRMAVRDSLADRIRKEEE